MAREFGMEWIELRSMWNKNIVNLDSKEIAEARSILERYQLRVTDIASPLFKVDWPGAPRSRFSPKESQFNADFSFIQQEEVLERGIELAKAFRTDRWMVEQSMFSSQSRRVVHTRRNGESVGGARKR